MTDANRAADPTRLLAHELAALLRSGELSSREATEASLEAAERGNHALNAWLSIDRERALAEADAADARLAAARAESPAALAALHPLLGVPVALKDLVSMKGGQCTAGSRILEGYVAPYDAHITERLHDVGAVILGKTNMDEFAMGSSTEHSAYGPDGQPLGSRPGARRQQRWLGDGRGRLPRPAWHRDGHRRLDPPAGGSVRDRRDEADLRPGQPLRDRGLRLVARPDRALRPRRARRRRAAPRGRRPRRARLDLRAGAGPRRAAPPARLATTRLPRTCAASGWGCPASTSCRAWSRAARPGSGRPSRSSRRPARPSRRSACPIPTTGWPPTTSSPRRRPRRTWPATTGSATARPSATATSWPTTWPPAAVASGPRSSAGSCSGRTPCRRATTTRSTSRRRRSGR